MAQFEFLGRLSDQFATPLQYTLPSELTTIAQLRPWLNQALACELFSDPSIRAIVNDHMAVETTRITDTDVIIFYPPVGGG